ncbi:DUF4199 domain-containing protein [Solitalea koreensis]|uniref:DUF4199 domain-containing protein n=1 Tax=Solitalea koreensis TaxID=543615 RepID=A0A521CJV5_9SPHI|nr:DUF4199 domain-containing protein [Solitalea koreensis]SMO59718.1 Protein of unknown function [Solitalea koreensis]
MKNTAIKFALIALATTIIWTLTEHFLGFNTTKHEIGQHTRLVTPFVFYACVVLGILSFKNHQNHNNLSWAGGLKTGALISVIYGSLSLCWFALYAEVINPEYASTLKAYELNKLRAANATAAEIAERMKDVELSTGGSFLSYFFLFLFMTLFGCLIALIATWLLRKKRKII